MNIFLDLGNPKYEKQNNKNKYIQVKCKYHVTNIIESFVPDI